MLGLLYGIANEIDQATRLVVSIMLQLAMTNGIDTWDVTIAYGERDISLCEVGVQGFKLVAKLLGLIDFSFKRPYALVYKVLITKVMLCKGYLQLIEMDCLS